MKKQTAHSFLAALLIFLSGISSVSAETAAVPAPKKHKSTLLIDMTDHATFYELTEFLRLDRIYRRLMRKKVPSEDINVYDEVADSAFFENRHARNPLTPEELEKGYWENDGPSPEGALTIVKGKTEGLHPGFFVKDARGDGYLLKFDVATNPGLTTAAEIISSRFYYAIGYHVPQYTVFTFDPKRLVPGEKATMVDRTGFTKKLTPDLLDEFLIQLPQDSSGHLRASASKILAGQNMGNFDFEGRRKDDPEDTVLHERRRTVRALTVFGSWLNNNDVRDQNTLDMWVTENGKSYLKHYLIDFNSTLGGAAQGAKPPMFTHDYFIDYGETLKNYFMLGLRKSDWIKRWEAAGQKENASEELGYIDNNYFSPEKFKVQLPYYAFKDITRADIFWAAKIIMSFRDEDLKPVIKAGKMLKAEDEDYICKILLERRDLIGRYGFSQASPLVNFNLENGKFSFSDLETHYGFAEAEGSVYTIEGISGSGKKGRSLKTLQSSKPEFEIPGDWIQSAETLKLFLRVKRPSEKKERPYVLVEIHQGKITRVLHQD